MSTTLALNDTWMNTDQATFAGSCTGDILTTTYWPVERITLTMSEVPARVP